MAKPAGFDLVSGDGFKRLENDVKALLERIKHKAYEVSQREFARKDHIRDWLDAECEMSWRAPVIVRESATDVTIEVAVPGMTAEHLAIGGKPGKLIVRGTKSSTSNRALGAASVREYNAESVYREIALPHDADPTRADVQVEHGVLTLKIARGSVQKPTPVTAKPTIAPTPAPKAPVVAPKVEAKPTPAPAKKYVAPAASSSTKGKPGKPGKPGKSGKSYGAGN